MKCKRRPLEIFNLSFLDIIACALGATIMLVLVSHYADSQDPQAQTRLQDLLSQVMAAEARVDEVNQQLADAKNASISREMLLSRLQDSDNAAQEKLGAQEDELDKLQDETEGLSLVQRSLKKAAIRPKTAKIRDQDEIGGIPVDSDYVVFIIDTSGSMKAIWNRVVKELVNVIEIHPTVKGFQIINDNGSHLISGYAGKWIKDTPIKRRNVIKLLRTWSSTSNSSPVEGLEVALKRYVKPGKSVSIYIFGDDYSGSSYDPVINTVSSLNKNRINGNPLSKIHAVGFLTQSRGRFPVLMREVTRLNGGTFIALPL
jgi:hypothetical protein